MPPDCCRRCRCDQEQVISGAPADPSNPTFLSLVPKNAPLPESPSTLAASPAGDGGKDGDGGRLPDDSKAEKQQQEWAGAAVASLGTSPCELESPSGNTAKSRGAELADLWLQVLRNAGGAGRHRPQTARAEGPPECCALLRERACVILTFDFGGYHLLRARVRRLLAQQGPSGGECSSTSWRGPCLRALRLHPRHPCRPPEHLLTAGRSPAGVLLPAPGCVSSALCSPSPHPLSLYFSPLSPPSLSSILHVPSSSVSVYSGGLTLLTSSGPRDQ